MEATAMNEQYDADYSRNEMFAIGAAAGALVATAIQEVLDRRRQTPQSRLEQARDRASGLAQQGASYVSNLQESAQDYVADLTTGTRRQRRKARKAARKSAKRGGSSVDSLKEAAVSALGAAAI